jgi:hypothetical protein
MDEKTEGLLKAWMEEERYYTDALAKLESSRKKLKRMSQAIGERLVPGDAKDQETFGLWMRDQFDQEKCLCVTVHREGPPPSSLSTAPAMWHYDVKWRE